MENLKKSPGLPVKQGMKSIFILSILMAGLMIVVSTVGFWNRNNIYPTRELLETFAPNDAVNLFIGVPVLLVSLWLAWRGKWFGLLCWPGALIFIFYNYLAYAIALPFGWRFPIHMILVVLSVMALIGVIKTIDADAVKQRLEGRVREKLTGGILAGFGALFLSRALGIVVGALTAGTMLPISDLAVNIADMSISPAMIIGGILLWRKKAPGYASGLGLLYMASMLFVALIAFFILQPVVSPAAFKLVDTLVILVMGMVCFIPFILFTGAVVKK